MGVGVGLGVVDDTFDEFMVKEDTGLDRAFALKMYNDSYWERRYTISAEYVVLACMASAG